MRDWFESLEYREQVFVGVGALVVLLAVLYAVLWLPFDRKHDELKKSVSGWQASLEELRPLGALAKNASKPVRGSSNGTQMSPILIVERTLGARGLESYRSSSNPTTSTGIRVEFDNVAFDDLVLWLGDLSSQYSMHVQAGTFASGNRAGPGRVNASLTLERSL